MRVLRRLWYLLHRRRVESDLVEEMRCHRALNEQEPAHSGHAKDDIALRALCARIDAIDRTNTGMLY